MLDTDQGAGGAVASRDAPGAGRTLRVSVLVHGATGLDSGEIGIEPAAFVAAKTMREAAARQPRRGDEGDPEDARPDVGRGGERGGGGG